MTDPAPDEPPPDATGDAPDRHPFAETLAAQDAAARRLVLARPRHGRPAVAPDDDSVPDYGEEAPLKQEDKRETEVTEALTLAGAFGRAARIEALAELGAAALADWEIDLRAARRRFYRRAIFGDADAKPTLAQARAWLAERTRTELDDDDKVAVAGALQWLRDDLGWKMYLSGEPDEAPQECLVTAPLRSDVGRRRFQFRTSGLGRRTLAQPAQLPAGLTLDK